MTVNDGAEWQCRPRAMLALLEVPLRREAEGGPHHVRRPAHRDASCGEGGGGAVITSDSHAWGFMP
jgi:hypothetical protein